MIKFKRLPSDLKSDSRGFTLIELIVAISLVTVILSTAYFLLNFSQKSLIQTQAGYDAIQKTRIIEMRMEKEIRNANAVNIGGVRHLAVEVNGDGTIMNVYTDIDHDDTQELVQYKLDSNKLKRGVAELGSLPTVWSTLAGWVKNKMTPIPTAMFNINSKEIRINILVVDEEAKLMDDPVSVTTSITVRSKGAMNE